jgi:CheY-like chemotaxis protein
MSNYLANEDVLDLKLKFITSTKEKLEGIEFLVLMPETKTTQNRSKIVLQDVLAISHSIVSGARSYKLDALALVCNKLEDYISTLLNYEKIISAEELTKIVQYTDLLESYCSEFITYKTVDDINFTNRYQKIFSLIRLQKSTTTKTAAPAVQLHILMVSINKIIMKQVSMSLLDINHTVSFAVDPLDAFHRIAQEKFDLIISSFIMEPVDGLSFSLAVKNQWKEKAPKIILLCTEPVAMTYDQLLLPDKIFIKSLELPQELKTYFSKEFPASKKPPTPVIKKTNHQVKSIYFVEDDINILELFLLVFTENKDVVLFNEVTTKDPYERITQLLPDLIICDIHVPNVDTSKLLLKIKTTEELSKIPIVFFTGDPNQPIAKDLLKNGALAVLDKTIILTSMFDELEKLGIELQTNV